jgi:hypothetical protein
MLLLNEVQKLNGIVQDLQADNQKFGAMLRGIAAAMNTAALNLE